MYCGSYQKGRVAKVDLPVVAFVTNHPPVTVTGTVWYVPEHLGFELGNGRGFCDRDEAPGRDAVPRLEERVKEVRQPKAHVLEDENTLLRLQIIGRLAEPAQLVHRPVLIVGLFEQAKGDVGDDQVNFAGVFFDKVEPVPVLIVDCLTSWLSDQT